MAPSFLRKNSPTYYTTKLIDIEEMNSSPVTLHGRHRVKNLSYTSEAPAFNITASPHPVNTNATSTSNSALFTCDGVCISITVVLALVIFCASIGLFIILGFGCKRDMNRWIWNNNRRRTNSPVAATGAINLNPRRPRPRPDILTFEGLPPVPPYPGSTTLPPYSSPAIQNIPVNNIGPGANSQTDDQISNTSLVYTSFMAQTLVISLNSTNTGELPIPPTPLISTIPLPPVDIESTINDVVHPDFLFQNNSNDARSGTDGQLTQTVCSNHSNDGTQFGTESNPSDFNLNLESVQPTGSLGLIFKSPLTSCDVHADFGPEDNSSASLMEGDPSPRQSTSGI